MLITSKETAVQPVGLAPSSMIAFVTTKGLVSLGPMQQNVLVIQITLDLIASTVMSIPVTHMELLKRMVHVCATPCLEGIIVMHVIGL
jgi:hypothetical protein